MVRLYIIFIYFEDIDGIYYFFLMQSILKINIESMCQTYNNKSK